MASWWPWLAVAGVGALHGLNPATGWIFVASRGARFHDRAQMARTLLPIAVGHALSIALVAGAVVLGLALDRVVLQVIAGALLAVVAAMHLRNRGAPRRRFAPARGAALALWSFIVSSAHGAGLMLVPALLPLCAGNAAPARAFTASGSLALALAALAVHTASMLAAIAVVSMVASRGVDAGLRWLASRSRRRPFPSLQPLAARDQRLTPNCRSWQTRPRLARTRRASADVLQRRQACDRGADQRQLCERVERVTRLRARIRLPPESILDLDVVEVGGLLQPRQCRNGTFAEGGDLVHGLGARRRVGAEQAA